MECGSHIKPEQKILAGIEPMETASPSTLDGRVIALQRQLQRHLLGN